MDSSIYLAAEDEPGLAVGRKLIAEAPPLALWREENGRGYGSLKAKAPSFDKMGRRIPVLLITDLDSDPCPSFKVRNWLGHSPSEGFLFRICVREVESWLMGDTATFARFFQIPEGNIPSNPESLSNPKAELFALAQFSKKRAIRQGIVPSGTASIGPEYNILLSEYIRDYWDPGIAAKHCSSLSRARHKLQALARTVRRLG